MDQMFRLECRFYIPLIPCQAVSIQYSWADNQKCLFFYQSQISPPYCKWRLWEKMCALWDIDSEMFLFRAKTSIFSFRTSENFLCGFFIFSGVGSNVLYLSSHEIFPQWKKLSFLYILMELPTTPSKSHDLNNFRRISLSWQPQQKKAC